MNGLLTVGYTVTAGTGSQLSAVTLYVDCQYVWEKEVSQGSTFKYDTTQVSNGQHQMELRVSSTDADGGNYQVAKARATFTANNYVSSFQIPEIVGGHEPVMAKFSTSANWTLSFEQGGSVVYSTSGTGTYVNYTWNCAGASDSSPTIVRLTATEAGTTHNYVVGGHTYTWYLGSVNSPTYCVHWAREEENPGMETALANSAQYAISKLQSNSRYGYMPNPDFRRRWNGESDMVYLRDNAIGNPPSGMPPCIYCFYGHGGGGAQYGCWAEGHFAANQQDSTLYSGFRWWGLSAFKDSLWPATRYHNLGPAIGNIIAYDESATVFPGRLYYAYLSRRFKFVLLSTCHSSEGVLSLAFGIPRQKFTGHGSAFLGFKDLTYPVGARIHVQHEVLDLHVGGLQRACRSRICKARLRERSPRRPYVGSPV